MHLIPLELAFQAVVSICYRWLGLQVDAGH